MTITTALLATVTLAAAPQTSLVEAVKQGDLTVVRALLKQGVGVDVNAGDPDGTSPLHWAAHRGDLAAVELLLRRGANAKATNRYGVSVLELACTRGNPAIVERLLQAGSDPNSASPEGETALMTAARTGNVDAAKVLLARGAQVNATEGWKRQTALMWAAAEGHVAMVRTLLEADADLRARSAGGLTPLLFAVRNGQMEATRTLLDAGADVNDSRSCEGGRCPASNGAQPPEEGAASALVLAIINAHYELAAMLLERGANPNVADARGSALHAVTWMRRPGLPNRGGGVIGAVQPRPTGAIDELELARRLLARGANPNVRLEWKEIRFDRDDGEAKDPPGILTGRTYISQVGATPFYLAAKNGDVELMRLLASHGADPLIPTVEGVTPLMVAAGLGYWDGETPGPLTGTPESERLEAVKLAIELGGDVNASATFANVTLVGDGLELLYTYPKNLEEYAARIGGDQRWNGSTALHGAALANQPMLVQYLVERGAKLDARNKLGWTPLMVAEGVFTGSTGKRSPDSEAMLRKLMQERGMNLVVFSQRGKIDATAR